MVNDVFVYKIYKINFFIYVQNSKTSSKKKWIEYVLFSTSITTCAVHSTG